MRPSACPRPALIYTLGLGLWAWAASAAPGAPVGSGSPEGAGKPVLVLRGHKSAIFNVAYSPDGALLATAGKDGTVRLWNAHTGTEARVLTVEGNKTAYCCAFHPEGRLLASAGADHAVRLWEVASGREVGSLKGHSGDVYNLAFSPDGRLLASASYDHSVRLWGLEPRKTQHILQGHADRVVGVAFHRDGRCLASCSTGSASTPQDEVRLWNADDGRLLFALAGTTHGAITVAFSPDGRRLAGACEKDGVRVWETATGKTALTLTGHTLQPYHVLFSPDGRWLASCSGSWNEDRAGEVKVWDLASGKEALTLGGYPAPIWSVAFSPDGRRLATCCGKWGQNAPGEVRVWSLADLRPADLPQLDVTPEELRHCWDELAGEDAAGAYRAVWKLRGCPRQSLAFLGRHVTAPRNATREQVARLVTELDHDEYEVREKASAALAALGAVASDALRTALRSPSAEVRRRAELLLAGPTGAPPLSAEEVRALRVLEVLAPLRGAGVDALLARLAAGPPGSPVTREARSQRSWLRAH